MLGLRVCNRSACSPVNESRKTANAAESTSLVPNLDQELMAIKRKLSKEAHHHTKLSPKGGSNHSHQRKVNENAYVMDESLPPYIPKVLCIPKEASEAPISSRDLRKLRKARSLSPKKNDTM